MKVSADTALLQNSLFKLKLFVSFAESSSLIYRSENARKLNFKIFNLGFYGSRLLLNNNRKISSR